MKRAEDIKQYYRAYMERKPSSVGIDIPTDDVLNALTRRDQQKEGGGKDGPQKDSQ